jgi:hypothetical protein
MLHTVSWLQYIAAVILITAAWYSYIGLQYYRAELQAWLRIRTPAKSPPPPVSGTSYAIMGEARPDEGGITLDSEEMIFSADSTPDDLSEQTILRGPSDDLFDEGKTLIEGFARIPDKTLFLSSLNTLVEKYELFREEISLPAIISRLHSYGRAKLPFSLNDHEWPNKWPDTEH